MSKMTLLNKYKNNLENNNEDSKIKSFLSIFKDIEDEYIKGKTPIPEWKAKEIIELGDFLANVDNLQLLKEFNVFKDIYKHLKIAFDEDKDFCKECDDILCNLDVNEVRELETLYKLLTEIKLDKEYCITYSDGLVFSYKIPLNYEEDIQKVLENKSFIARALKNNGIFICDFFDFEEDIVYTAGFVFENHKWYTLKENFVKNIHSIKSFKKQEFLAVGHF